MKNRIKEIRERKGIGQKELAEKINTSQQAISLYETGKREPRFETWQELANFFGVSIPYLQGYAKINIPSDLKFDSKQDAIECIEKIMKTLDISKEDLEKNIDDEGDKDAKR